MKCTEIFEKLFELCSGELAPGEDAGLRAHIAGCAVCGRDLAETEALLVAVRRCCGSEAADEFRDIDVSELIAACCNVRTGDNLSEKGLFTTMKTEGRLSYKEKELVALGASLAAGCIPCTRHHVTAVEAAGASQEEIDRSIDAALCVKSSTRGIMESAVREALGSPAPVEASCCAGPTDRMRELVSIAAAVAVNCPTNLEKHVRAGRDAGARDDEMRIAISLGRAMRGKASEKVDAATAAAFTAKDTDEAGCCEGGEASTKPQASTGSCAPPEVSAARESEAPAKPGCC